MIFLSQQTGRLLKKDKDHILYNIVVNDLPEYIDHIEFYYNEKYDNACDQGKSINDKYDFDLNKKYDISGLEENLQSNLRIAELNMNTEILEKTKYSEYILPLKALTGKEITKLLLSESLRRTVDEYEAPRNKLEDNLVKIYETVLNVENIGISSDFFELGGDSLKAINLLVKIHKEFNIKLTQKHLFEAGTIKKLVERISYLKIREPIHIKPTDKKEYYELSSSQKRMYILSEKGNTTNYNISFATIIEGNLDISRLEKAFEVLVLRHESLRTSFELIDGIPRQKVNNDIIFKIEYVEDLVIDIETEIHKFIKIFKLDEPLLLRVKVVKKSRNTYLMFMDIHHIIFDGMSMNILFNELIQLYRGERLEPLTLQYKDFSYFEARNYNFLIEQKKYWNEIFKDNIPVLDMPLDFKRPERQTFNGDIIEFKISKKNINNLKRIVKNINLNVAIFVIYSILLNKYTDQDEFIIGSVTAGRNYNGTENMVGNFLNFLPIRNKLNISDNYVQTLKSYAQNMILAYQNQEYPFEKIVEDTRVNFDSSRNPLFDTAIVFHNELNTDMLTKKYVSSDLSFKCYPIKKPISTIDFKLDILLYEDGFNCQLEYNTDIFTKSSMQKFSDHFQQIIKEVIKSPDKKISDIHIKDINEFKEKDRHGIKNLQINEGEIRQDSVSLAQAKVPIAGLEGRLINIFEKVLKISGIGIEDDLFKIGGDSLKAVNIISQIYNDLGVKIRLYDLFTNSTVEMLSSLISNKDITIPYPILSVNKKEYYELSSSQKRMFILNQIDKEVTNYNESIAISLEGNLDKIKLKNAFKELIKRHESLRTGFEIVKGEVVQKIFDSVEFTVSFYKSNENITKLFRDFIKPFDLSKPKLLRVQIIERTDEKYILFLDIHHIIVDGTSFSILISELLALYAGRQLDPVTIQYKDFANWQNKLLQTKEMQVQEKYWISQFEGEIPVLNIYTDYIRPVSKSFDGSKKYFKLDRNAVKKLKEVCMKTQTTLFMVLFAAYNILLYRYTDQEDIVVGIPVAGRRHADLNNVVGMFINTLPIRTKPSGKIKFSDYLNGVKEIILNGLENQDYQYEHLLEKLNLSRDMSRNPLFDVMFTLQNMDKPEMKINNLNIDICKLHNNRSTFDITIYAVEKDDEIEFEIEYCVNLFKIETIERLKDHFLNILEDISENHENLISEIKLLNENEKEEIIYNFNKTKTDYPIEKTIHELFAEQVEKIPEEKAIVFENKYLTYRELNTKANQLARVLRTNGVKRDMVVGIMVERSFDLIIGVLGILKAGGAYLPIDHELPNSRKKYMLENCKIKNLLINNKANEEFLFDGKYILIDDGLSLIDGTNLENINTSTDLLYVIYTSGSTGNQKGVMIEHKNINNLISFQYSRTNIDFKSSVLQFASMSFDVCFQEIFSTILAGGTLYILSDEDKKNMKDTFAFVKNNSIDILFLPTAYFKLISSNESYLDYIPKCVKHIIVAGEKLTISHSLKTYLKNSDILLHNHYGPAETHVVTTYTLDRKMDINSDPYIGKPISNTKIYILDEHLKVQPVGIPGEIYIAGDSVGRGYINNEELTSNRYLNDYITNQNLKMYKTGDIGKWNYDGNISYLGRKDNQVKVRGYRIELEEIENNLLKYDKIKQCVVVLKVISKEQKDLVAYFTANELISISKLKSYLKELLPGYMVPKYFVQVEHIKLNRNGKVDKADLLTTSINISEYDTFEKPNNNLEKKLFEVWSSVFERDNISINDNLFEIGGDSLLIMKLVLEASKKGLNILVKDLYLYPTIKEFCKNNLGKELQY